LPDVCHIPLWALRAGAVGNETLLGPGLALQASLRSTYPLTPLSVDPVQKGKGSDRGGGDAGFDR